MLRGETPLRFWRRAESCRSSKYTLRMRYAPSGWKASGFISGRILAQTSMASIAHPYLKKLSDLTGETVHLVRREGTEAVYIDKVESNVGSIRMVSRVGSRIPLYCSGVGKALLSELSEEEIRAVWNESEIKKLTPHTITELSELFERVGEVRKNGYAVDDEENEAGVRCVAVSLLDYHRSPVYALSISAPASRMDRERILELKDALLEIKGELMAAMGLEDGRRKL